MTQNLKLLTLGLAGGYLLGRTKKGKLALAVGGYVLGKRTGLNPQQLLTEGLKKLGGTPEFSRLNEQLRGDLMAAGRSLVTAAANRRLDSLSDALHERTSALATPQGEDEEPEEPEEERQERRPSKKAPTKKKAAGKRAEGKPVAKKAAPKTAAPKKTTAKKSAAKKTASRTTGRR